MHVGSPVGTYRHPPVDRESPEVASARTAPIDVNAEPLPSEPPSDFPIRRPELNWRDFG